MQMPEIRPFWRSLNFAFCGIAAYALSCGPMLRLGRLLDLNGVAAAVYSPILSLSRHGILQDPIDWYIGFWLTGLPLN